MYDKIHYKLKKKIGGLRTTALEDWDLVENFNAMMYIFFFLMYLNLFRALKVFLSFQGFRAG